MTLDTITSVFKALGHPARLRILALLEPGQLCVCQITAVLELASSTVSAHLSLLRQAGLVDERKQGRWVHYRLTGSGAFHRELLGAALDELRADPQVSTDRALLSDLKRYTPEEICRVDLDLSKLGIQPAGAGETG